MEHHSTPESGSTERFPIVPPELVLALMQRFPVVISTEHNDNLITRGQQAVISDLIRMVEKQRSTKLETTHVFRQQSKSTGTGGRPPTLASP